YVSLSCRLGFRVDLATESTNRPCVRGMKRGKKLAAPRKAQARNTRGRVEDPAALKRPPKPRSEPAPMPPPSKEWHADALAWHLSISESPKARYIEPIDWTYSRVVAGQLSTLLFSDKLSARALQTVFAAMDAIGSTVQARHKTGMTPEETQDELPTLEDVRAMLAEKKARR